MLNYVNAFTCSLNESKDTLVIHFLQNEPIVSDSDTETITITTHEISSLVMDSDCAKGLIASIAQLYDSESDGENN